MSQIVQQPDAHFHCSAAERADVDAIIKRQSGERQRHQSKQQQQQELQKQQQQH